jgi:hypothetical protein
MTAFANIEQFESLTENAGRSSLGVFVPVVVENIDLVSDPRTVQPISKSAPVQDDKFTPEWKKSVDERLGKLESNMEFVKAGVARIEAKLGK